MLILTRRPGEWVHIQPFDDLPAHMTVRELFARGPIRVFVGPVVGDGVRIGIAVPAALRVTRAELGGQSGS